MIEYYEGVLFLTTNRAADFDEAFQNRVHVTIKYPPLDTQKRACIWKSLLASDPNSPNSIVDATWTDSAYDILGQLEVNVRSYDHEMRRGVANWFRNKGQDDQEYCPNGCVLCPVTRSTVERKTRRPDYTG